MSLDQTIYSRVKKEQPTHIIPLTCKPQEPCFDIKQQDSLDNQQEQTEADIDPNRNHVTRVLEDNLYGQILVQPQSHVALAAEGEFGCLDYSSQSQHPSNNLDPPAANLFQALDNLNYNMDQEVKLPKIISVQRYDPNQKIYNCNWKDCGGLLFQNQGDLLVHMHSHITDLDWESPETIEHKCQWRNCWNKKGFKMSESLLGHVRVHTLEKPYICPVKSCKLQFALFTNCVTHGRTKHNRSVKPIFFDIIKGDQITAERNFDFSSHDQEEAEDRFERVEMLPRKRKTAAISNLETKRSRSYTGRTGEVFKRVPFNKHQLHQKNIDSLEESLCKLEKYKVLTARMKTEMLECQERFKRLASYLSDNRQTICNNDFQEGYDLLETSLLPAQTVEINSAKELIKNQVLPALRLRAF